MRISERPEITQICAQVSLLAAQTSRQNGQPSLCTGQLLLAGSQASLLDAS